MANALTGPGSQLAYPLSQGNVVSESAFPTIAGGSVRFVTGAPGVAEGRIMRLRAAVRVTGGTTTNYTLKLYWWSTTQNNTDLTTFTNDVNIISSGALAFNTTTNMLFMQSDLVWDSTSTKLGGGFQIYFGVTPTWTTWAVNTAQATVPSLATIRFFATGLFSATNANNAATLFDFSVDPL